MEDKEDREVKKQKMSLKNDQEIIKSQKSKKKKVVLYKG